MDKIHCILIMSEVELLSSEDVHTLLHVDRAQESTVGLDPVWVCIGARTHFSKLNKSFCEMNSRIVNNFVWMSQKASSGRFASYLNYRHAKLDFVTNHSWMYAEPHLECF